MAKVYSKALDSSLEVERIIAHIKGDAPGPTVVFTGGIHGNEPSGVFALHQVASELNEMNIALTGNFYAVSGNLWALERGERFQENDLNRLWTWDNIKKIKSGELQNEDVKQHIEINGLIEKILEEESGPFYFVDLHTTSSETMPFLTVNDSLLNRKFTEQFPVPMILGLEEYLDGPLLSHINELGYIAFGFEGGQHDDLAAIENHVAFIYLTLGLTGMVDKQAIGYDHHYQALAKTTIDTRDIYEIYYRHEIKVGEAFKMRPGFMNFQHVSKGDELADSNGQTIRARKSSRLFMPLYQAQGNDGFFKIRRIKPVFLRLSALLRKWRYDKLLPVMPGVYWATSKKEVLFVNRKVAFLFTKKFLHLLGYRSKQLDHNHLKVKNREAASRTQDYVNEGWYSR